MPGLYEYLKDPEVMAYLAMKDNPHLAEQMRRNDERNYNALLNAHKSSAMPDFPQMESRGNPQIEWMNRQGQAISQMKNDPALFEEAAKMYQALMTQVAQSNQLTAEQRNNAWNGYNVPPEQMDPYTQGAIQQRNKAAELDQRFKNDSALEAQKWGYRQAELKYKSENQKPSEKMVEADIKKKTGQEMFNTLLDDLEANYSALNNKKAMTNTDRGIVSNLITSAQQSTAGQALGSGIGTEEQSIRNKIYSARPLLSQAIMAATGMSARQLDSNVELQNFLKAATDPSSEYHAVMSQINLLRNLYSKKEDSTNTGSAGSGNPQQTSPQYKSADEIKSDYQSGKLPLNKAKELLKAYGYE